MSFISADQILAHLVGDYILQSHWMATNKGKSSIAAAAHVAAYTVPFVAITRNPTALFAILFSHFLVDRFRLARYLVWLKNGYVGEPVTATGYRDDVPPWLSVWLLIIADNTVHLICNGAAIAVWP